jgi:hypothetical protein
MFAAGVRCRVGEVGAAGQPCLHTSWVTWFGVVCCSFVLLAWLDTCRIHNICISDSILCFHQALVTELPGMSRAMFGQPVDNSSSNSSQVHRHVAAVHTTSAKLA